LYWQSNGEFLCVKVDRQTKAKKPTYTTLEIFRVKEKDIPVEVIEIKGKKEILRNYFLYRWFQNIIL